MELKSDSVVVATPNAPSACFSNEKIPPLSLHLLDSLGGADRTSFPTVPLSVV